jgi:hypothetical protein
LAIKPDNLPEELFLFLVSGEWFLVFQLINGTGMLGGEESSRRCGLCSTFWRFCRRLLISKTIGQKKEAGANRET